MNPSRKIARIASLCVFIVFITGCQNRSVQEPKNDLRMFKLVDSLNDLSFTLMRKRQYDQSVEISLQADSLSREQLYHKGTARSLRSRAYTYHFAGKPEQALRLLNESEELEWNSQNINGLASTYNTQAFVLKNNGLFKEAIHKYAKVLNIKDTLISEKRRVASLNNIANAYTRISQYDSAVIYYLKSLELNSVINNPRTLSIVYNNLGNAKSLIEDYESSKDYYSKALQKAIEAEDIVQEAKVHNNLGALYFELNDDGKSLDYFQKSIELKEEYEDSLSLGKSYLNIAEVYLQKNDSYLMSSQYLAAAEKIFKSLKDNYELANVYLSRAEYYNHGDNLLGSKNLLTKANQLLENSSDLSLRKEVYKNLAEVQNRLGDSRSAFMNYQKYDRLNDSVLNTEKLWEIADIEKKNQLRIKQGEISLIQKDRDLAELKAEQEEARSQSLFWMLCGSGLILILLILLIIYLQKLRRTNRMVAAQKQRLLEEQLENLIQNQEIEIINATMKGREKEKSYISNELHNNVGSLLTAVKFHLSGFNDTLMVSHKATKELYGKVVQMVDNVIHEVRDVSHRLDSEATAGFNLKQAIVEFSHKVESGDLKVETSIHGLENFKHPQTSIFIFRVLQELINNVLKHAKASLLTLYLTRNDEHINIMVEDNGKGFEIKGEKKGIGLRTLKEQVLNRNGDFTVDTVKMKGTTVIINLPVL